MYRRQQDMSLLAPHQLQQETSIPFHFIPCYCTKHTQIQHEVARIKLTLLDCRDKGGLAQIDIKTVVHLITRNKGSREVPTSSCACVCVFNLTHTQQRN